MKIKASQLKRILAEELDNVTFNSLNEVYDTLVVSPEDFTVSMQTCEKSKLDELKASSKQLYNLLEGYTNADKNVILEVTSLDDFLLNEVWWGGNQLEGIVGELATLLKTHSKRISKALAQADATQDRRLEQLATYARRTRDVIRDITFSAEKPTYGDDLDFDPDQAPGEEEKSMMRDIRGQKQDIFSDEEGRMSGPDKSMGRWGSSGKFYDAANQPDDLGLEPTSGTSVAQAGRMGSGGRGIDFSDPRSTAPSPPQDDDAWARDTMRGVKKRGGMRDWFKNLRQTDKDLRRSWGDTLDDMFG